MKLHQLWRTMPRPELLVFLPHQGFLMSQWLRFLGWSKPLAQRTKKKIVPWTRYYKIPALPRNHLVSFILPPHPPNPPMKNTLQCSYNFTILYNFISKICIIVFESNPSNNMAKEPIWRQSIRAPGWWFQNNPSAVYAGRINGILPSLSITCEYPSYDLKNMLDLTNISDFKSNSHLNHRVRHRL